MNGTETTATEEVAPQGEWDPKDYTAAQVLRFLESADADETSRVLDLEESGKARKSVLELVPFDPSEHKVDEVLAHLDDHADDPDEVARVVRLETEGKGRKGVLERAEGVGPLGATTVLREDFAGRNLVDPTGTAKDYLGRNSTSTADYMGRNLRRTIRSASLAVTLGQEIQYADGTKYAVTTAGTTHATVPPASPAVGATVTDGTAVLTRTR